MRRIIVIVLLFITIDLVSQSISYNEEFQVSTNSNPTNESSPKVCDLVSGGFVISWAGGSGIFTQLYNETLEKVGNEFLITSSFSSAKNSSVCGLANGGFIVTWEGYDKSNDGLEVFAQIFDKSGLKVGENFKANSYTYDDQKNASVCSLNNDSFVVCWESYGQDGSYWGIYAQIFDENGIKVNSEFQVNTYTDGYQSAPSISKLTNGGFAICWESWNQDGTGCGIYAQIYNENGDKQGDEFRVNPFSNDRERKPSISRLTNGGFVICWVNYESDEIFAQICDDNGEKITNEFKVNSFPIGSARGPNTSLIVERGFSVCWESYNQDGDQWGIYSQLFDDKGTRTGEEFKVNDFTKHSQIYPSVSSLINGDLIVCWQTYGQTGFTYGVYGKYYYGTPINHLLSDFELLEPKLDATLNSNNPQFYWSSTSKLHINFPWELTYDLYIDTDESFLNPIIIYGIEDTTYQTDSLNPGKTYFWKVLARNYYGDSLWSSSINGFFIDPNATDIEITENSLPDKFELYQNYPNPFNPTTIIKYSLPAGRQEFQTHNIVQLKVYDVLGKEVATLVNKEQSAGSYEVEFDANTLTSGIYFYRIFTGKYSETRKMILMR